jgi:putative transposase
MPLAEIVSRNTDRQAWSRGVQPDFIRPCKPVDVGYVERFDGRVRDECLNTSCFVSLGEARRRLALFREDHRNTRLRSSSGQLPPSTDAQTVMLVSMS